MASSRTLHLPSWAGIDAMAVQFQHITSHHKPQERTNDLGHEIVSDIALSTLPFHVRRPTHRRNPTGPKRPSLRNSTQNPLR